MSKFTEYWKNIDNTPGTLESLTKGQLADVKRMVKAAFHAGHHRIEKLEQEAQDGFDQLAVSQREVAELEAKLDAVWKVRQEAVVDRYQIETRNRLIEELQADNKRLASEAESAERSNDYMQEHIAELEAERDKWKRTATEHIEELEKQIKVLTRAISDDCVEVTLEKLSDD